MATNSLHQISSRPLANDTQSTSQNLSGNTERKQAPPSQQHYCTSANKHDNRTLDGNIKCIAHTIHSQQRRKTREKQWELTISSFPPEPISGETLPCKPR
ncbi:hypothetical protein CLAIMM_14404 isoform 1 [Cladophialophora immunda]|nr:hypothetical protein CLAIMM_14404 isoform 1 [Cladophialophora immunda]